MDASFDATQSPRWLSSWLPALLIALVALHYFSFLNQHAINVPLGDDIYDVLQVVSGLQKAPDLASAWETIYTQHNDHRTLSSRLVYYGSYLLTGEINFRTLTFLANLALPLLLFLLLRMSYSHPLPILVLLPAALVLLQLRAYGITLWSMAAFAYHFVFLYGFAAIYCLHRVTPLRFVIALCLATLATFSLASGQAIWLIGLIALLHQWLFRDSNWRYPLGWVIAAILILKAWRVGLETPNTLYAMLEFFFHSPGHHILYTLSLLGSAVSENNVGIAALAGAAMLVALLTGSLRSLRSDDIRLTLCAWFVVLSVVAMVLGRAPYSTVDYALSSRYSFPSILLLATCWMMLAVNYHWRSWLILGPAVTLAICYNIYSYQTYSNALQPYVEKRVENFNKGRYFAWTRSMKETSAIVAEAVELDIYHPPATPLPTPRIGSDKKTTR